MDSKQDRNNQQRRRYCQCHQQRRRYCQCQAKNSYQQTPCLPFDHMALPRQHNPDNSFDKITHHFPIHSNKDCCRSTHRPYRTRNADSLTTDNPQNGWQPSPEQDFAQYIARIPENSFLFRLIHFYICPATNAPHIHCPYDTIWNIQTTNIALILVVLPQSKFALINERDYSSNNNETVSIRIFLLIYEEARQTSQILLGH